MENLVYYLKQAEMNPQKTIRLILLLFFAAVVISACKKDEQNLIQPDSSSVQQLSKDDKSVEENMDEAMIDAGQVLAGSNKSMNMDIPCGATLESTTIVNDTIVYRLVYDGLNCIQTRYRTGVVLVKIKQNSHWLLPGAFLTIEFQNYEVTNVFTNNKMKINGFSMLENVSGGILQLLGNGFNAIIHKNTAHVFIAFNDHPPRGWHLTKMLVYSGQAGNYMLAVNGFGNAQGFNNLLSWGVDREGKQFFTQIGEAVVFKESCQWLPYSGEQLYTIPGEGLKATVSFGYNENNEPITGSECPTRYKLLWQQHGQSGTIFLPLGNK